MKTNIIGLKELRQNTDDYIDQVKKGKSFIVMRRSTPVFKLSPISDEEEQWKTIIDFTKIKKGGVSAEEVLKALRQFDAQS